MRSASGRIFAFIAIVVLASNLAGAQGAKAPAGNRPQSESERDHPQERAKWFLRGRTVNGRPAARELQRAYRQKLNNRHLRSTGSAKISGAQTTLSSETASASTAQPAPSATQSTGGPSWTALGPAPTATSSDTNQDYGPAVGRATAVVVDQSDTTGNTVYVGGASGGLWGTTDAVSAGRSCDGNGVCTASPTWTPLMDNQPSLAVGAIALSPGNTDCAAASPLNCIIVVGTGEANNSADSYYGLGFLRSANGGASWSLISSANAGTINLHGLGFTKIAFSVNNPQVVAATAAAASEAITLGAETGGTNARGIYYSLDAGASWSRASVLDAPGVSPSPGSANSVVYNATTHTFFANIRYHGFYSSPDGMNWTRLASQPNSSTLDLSLTNCPSATSSNCPLYRAEIAVVPGRNEMYVWIYDVNENDKGIYQTLNGGNTWTQISTSGIDTCGDGTGNGCGTGTSSQGTYNITLAAIPNGTTATDLYAGGVNQYKCTIEPVLNPTCATKPFMNLTHVYGCNPLGNIAHVHPDEHGIDFLGNDGTGAMFAANPSLSPPVFFANDGGIYRVLHSYLLNSGTCPASGTMPDSQFDNLNTSMGSMIQFVWFSQHPTDTSTLFGGTQDNGSPAVSGASPSNNSWISVNNGDGGFNDVNPLNTSEWFTSNPDMSSGGSIQRCTSGINCTSGSFLTVVAQSDVGGDNSEFYTPFVLDPQASTRMIVGTCRVWRGNSDGTNSDGSWSANSSGGNPLSYNFDSSSATVCASSAVNMVTALAAGGPCYGTACNAGPTSGASNGGGSQVLWAGTDGDNTTGRGGEVWVTTNANGGPATWKEVSGNTAGVATACTSAATVCNINPLHYPISGIAVDPHVAAGTTAYVTIMGFNAGHVFKTPDAGATWSLLDGNAGGTGLPDNPADAVAVDPVTSGLVYVATDVGVFQSFGDGNWAELGPGSGAGSLPNVATTALKVYKNGGAMRLRVSTYGRGLWEIPVGTAPGFTVSVSNASLSAFPGQTASYNATLSTYNGYNNSILVYCTAGSTAPPATCPTQASPITLASSTTNFTVTAGNTSLGDFSFYLTATGSDGFTQQVPVTFHAVDFSLGAPPPATVGQGDSADVSFNLSALGSFTGNVNLSCSGNPAGDSCTFTPAIASLTPNATVNVRLTIPTSTSTALGAYTVTITGTTTAAGGGTHSQTMALNVTTASFLASAATSLTPVSGPTPPRPGQQLTATVTVSSKQSYAGTLNLTCGFDPSAGDPGLSICSVTPSGVTLAAGAAQTATLLVATAGALATDPTVIVTASDTNNASSSAVFPYHIVDYSLVAATSGVLMPGGSITMPLTLQGQNGYTGTVAVQCNAPAPLTCLLSPLGPYAVSPTAPTVNATVAAPAGTAATTYAVAINSNDASYPALTHNQIVTAAVQDFSLTACNTASTGACNATGTVTAGGSASFKVAMTAVAGFTGNATLAISGCPTLTTCSLSQASISAGGSATLTITTTAPSVSQMLPPSQRRGAPLYALWLTLPGMVVGIFSWGCRERRRKVLGGIGLALILAVLLQMAACGGGGGTSTTSPPIPKPGTPAGTYNIVVSATSGSGASVLTHAANITLTVQ